MSLRRASLPLVLLVALLACSSRPRLAFEARAAAEEADVLAAQGRGADGARLLEALARGAVNHSLSNAVDYSLVQDAWAHAAQLWLAAHDAAAAEQAASAGLALGETDDVYEATLRILRGRARELLARDVEAATDYDRAAAIDERLLEAGVHLEDGR